MDERLRKDKLLPLLGGTRLAILSLLFSDEGRGCHLREIVRELGVGHGAAQRELARLTEEGFLERSKSGNRVCYKADRSGPLFTELSALIVKSKATTNPRTSKANVKLFIDSSGAVAEICASYHVSRLFVFGSSLRGEDTPGSDLDLLVEFEHGHTPGLDFFTLEDELSQALGRKVDLNTQGFLSRNFREDVLKEAQEVYVVTK